MAILKVARLGNPILRKVAESVPIKSIFNPEVQRLIQDMVETMKEYNGVGLAAPQIHESLQIIVVDAVGSSRNPEPKKSVPAVLINPTIRVISEREISDWEGCLSIPDLRGLVPRYEEIEVEAFDTAGKALNFHAQGFHARVIQHEHDHLMGRVFLDRMRTFESLTHLREFSRFWQQREP
jgi:peptide deformylase